MVGMLHRFAFSVAGTSQRLMVNATTRRFSAWARVDRWLAGLSDDARRNLQGDPVYARFTRAEADYWRNPPVGDENSVHDNPYHPARSPQLKAYINETVSGDPEQGVPDYLKGLGRFGSALVLSHFTHLKDCLNSDLARSWTFNDYAGRFRPERYTDRPVRIIRQDLNFPSLEAGAYDLVIGDGLLHHLINVDLLAEQVSRSLRPGGLFVIPGDYCGERRFRWAKPHRERMDAVLREIDLKDLRYPLCSVDAIHFSAMSPFEAVNGPGLRALLGRYFEEIRFRPSHGLLFPTLAYLKQPLLERDNEVVSTMIARDRQFEGSTFSAVYRKKD